MSPRRVGAIFTPDRPPEDFRQAIQLAESSGIDELWVWEDCFRESAFAAATAALAWSERIQVGIGIAPMPLRNVALTAMEIATIERMFPGRLLPGLGHGVLSWMGQAGARVASPLTLMREYIPALRALLTGEEVSTSGRYVNLDRVKLDWPPSVAPLVYAAGEGPKTLTLTGEVADGTVLTGGTPPEGVAAASARIATGRAAAGRTAAHATVVFVPIAVGTDASARAARHLERWNRPGEFDKIAAGSLTEVVSRLEEFYDAGAGAVLLQPLEDDLSQDEFFAVAAEVAARLR